ncbi:ribosome biogenesis GTPase A [Butyrivibrio sp. INlla18]|uniref:ribosome biogenesis GTPase YlqF n=1 Tax=unclassified Butyrivibrio TaxID=2639466 RepID=UPI000882F37E|nr:MULTISPECIES: ribosome biogenesis GTPase YlqF [unclassified Butyrivibrio]MBE5841820.1 ribosome biogenesis GTPase YlqF [Butyrivibrio sp.]MCR4756424.1 ribosome biogenesis GTPase YlqF [Butyrivibrio sp.]SDA67738.1 ribosome biogenesis GTPase A [Butyrivibrio sp. INlla18]
MNLQWYPGHMTKAIRMMQENIKLIDIIIEITDARIPASGRNPDIDELGKNKFRLIILNKADLADPAITKRWKEYYQKQGYFVMEMNSKTGNEAGKVKELIQSACAEKIEKDKKRGIVGRPIRAMVAGIPNVGKSTFINKLAGKASAKTGNKPGVTKGKQWISLGKNLQLLDTPGILWPKFEDQTVGLHLAFIGSMNDENIDTDELACELIKILKQYYPNAISEKYNITDEQIDELMEDQYQTPASAVLSAIAINRKCFKQGATPDISRASALLLDDFRNGRLGRLSLERPD